MLCLNGDGRKLAPHSKTLCKPCYDSMTKEERTYWNNLWNRCQWFWDGAFQFTLDEFRRLVHSDCHYCGAHGDPLNGLDRVDSNKGYEPGNIVPCCRWCNRAKFTRAPEEFIEHARRIANRHTS